MVLYKGCRLYENSHRNRIKIHAHAERLGNFGGGIFHLWPTPRAFEIPAC